MRPVLLSIVSIPVILIVLFSFETDPTIEDIPAREDNDHITITDIVERDETLESIFTKYNLDRSDMLKIFTQSREQYDLSRIAVGSVYSFILDKNEQKIQSMQYGIDDRSYLNIIRESDGFITEKITLPLDRRTGFLNIQIKDNLVSSMPGTHKEYLKLALALSDIYAWDIDFSSDVRNGDSVKILIEELWVGDIFRGYGDILAAEFINNGEAHRAFRFEHEGYVDYYDEKGRSLRKTLLRSPLRFKYISSGFSRRRYHPVLRTYRPHLGIDYAAPPGTPVSSAGSGTVLYTGYKGQNGRMVTIRHPGGYVTYYGHLARIPKKIKKGSKVSQGDIIGYVGSTGLSTGPHLDYRIKLNGRFVNPLTINLPRGKSVPDSVMARFLEIADSYDKKLAVLNKSVAAWKE